MAKKPAKRSEPRKSAIDLAADTAKDYIEEMAEVKCPIEEYLAALKDVRGHLDIAIEAAEMDLQRQK